MPASASPVSTLFSSDLTSSSSDTGLTFTPCLSRAWRPYLPAGTDGSSSTTLRSERARSESPLTPFGLPGDTTISRRILSKAVGVSTRLAATNFCMLVWSAVATTSAGAPDWICATSCWEPAKLYVTIRPGLAATRWFLSSVKASVSEAAANTVTDPDSFGESVEPAAGGGVGAPQAASKRDRPNAARVKPVGVSKVTSSYGGLGSSTVTLVVLTAGSPQPPR